jgi:hypothetical protein
LAVRFAVAALTLYPKLIFPLFPVVVSAIVPEAANADAVVIALLSLTERLVNVSPPEARLSAPVFTTVAVPVVLSVMLGVAVLIDPILPEPVLIANDVVPVTVPVPVIAPDVDAVTVSVVPDTFALIAMPPVAVVAYNPNVPVAVIVLPIVTAPAPAA